MERKLLVINEKDNVGVLLEKANAGDTCTWQGSRIEIREAVEFAHKIALQAIPRGAAVYKYGEEIGHAEADIQRGQWVHNHNMGCRRGK
jgi:hypothetical protein